jgi:hypothetical protein
MAEARFRPTSALRRRVAALRPPWLPAGALRGLAFALIAVALVRWGLAVRPIGMSPDSGAYLSIGMSWRAGLGFHSLEGRYLQHWPPLYPFLLGLLDGLKSPILRSIARLNEASIFVTVLFAGLWIARHVRSLAVSSLALAFLALAPSMTGRVALWAWSEVPWLVFVTGGLYALDCHLGSGRLRSLAAAIVFAGAAALTRYVGVSSIAALGVALWIGGRGGFFRRTLRAGLASALAMAPLGAWMARNWAHGKTLTGPRDPAVPGQLGVLVDTALRTLGDMLWPFEPDPKLAPSLARTLLPLSIVALVLALGVAYAQGRKRADLRPLIAPIVLCVVQIGLVVTMLSRVHADPIDERYFVGLMPAVTFLLAFSAQRLASIERAPLALAARGALLALALLVLRAEHKELDVRLRAHRDAGGGYTGRTWDDFATFLQTNWPREGEVWANCPEFVLYRLGKRVPFGPPTPLPERWAPGGGTLIWAHDHSDRTDAMPLWSRLRARIAHRDGALIPLAPP